MKFTARLALGSVLLLLCCWSLETTRLENVDSSSKSSEKTEKNLENNSSSSSQIQNLTKENNFKTENNNNNNNDEKVNGIKLTKSEPYKKSISEEIGRSFDVEKYYSNDFHNKNNVYNLSISKDTEKFINPDYEYHNPTGISSTHYFHNDKETTSENFDKSIDSIELTTPKSAIFDNKYQQTVDSVEQKLEHIDDSSHESIEINNNNNSKETNLEKLLNATRSNTTNANLNYINYKSLISNTTTGRGINNAIQKDNVVESGTQLNFQSSFNNTQIIDDDSDTEEDGSNNTIVKQHIIESTTTMRTFPASTSTTTTAKRIILLKPKPNQNPILSNKIEQEPEGKLISTENPKKGQPELVVEVNTKRTPIDITKRGSVKFSDYVKLPTTLKPKTTTVKHEELLQENQIVPISVEAPKNMDKNESVLVESTTTTTISSTTIESPVTTTIMPETTTLTTINVPETTTQFIVKTTDAFTTVQSEEDLSTTHQPEPELTTTEDNLTSTILPNFDSAATTIESTTLETSTIPENNNNNNNFDTTTVESSTIQDLTTESSLRTSKSFSFVDSVATTTDSITTTEIPTTESEFLQTTTTEIVTTEEQTILPETTTVELVETTVSDEPKEIITEKLTTTTTTEKNTVINNVTPEIHRDNRNFNGNTSGITEEITTTENSTSQTDPGELNGGGDGDNSGTIAAIVISSIGAVCLVLLAGLLIIMRKRQKRFNYGQRCTPVSLDDYSMDNVSVYNSVRRKMKTRSSKRSYGNPAFEDPASVSHPLNFPALGKFANNLEDMKAEFEEIPQITARTNELPEGCDTKNRYANVIPLPETRVFLTPIEGYPNSDYINANYVTGPKNTKGYYIACQAPMQSTVDDFWRMIWEQQCKVILMLTHHFENGVEKCADYLPPSEVLDCHRLFGDFQVTLKKREVKEKYVISILQLKNMVSNSWREVTHFWYMGWPEKGVPTEANSLIAFLIEARSYMKSSSIDRKEVTNGNVTNGTKKNEINPVVVHCSPGTGRTGVVIACDIAIREFEQTRLVDVPRIVYKIRRDRASSVQTKEQYIFIYKVINLYATKLTGGALDSL